MNEHFEFRKAVPDDALRLSFLFQHVYIDTYGREGVTTEFARFMTQRFSADRIAQTIGTVPDAFYVATFREHVVGAAELIWDAEAPLAGIRAPELSKLYVLERFCGKAVGLGLLQAAEEAARAKGSARIWLEVYAHNPRAIAFYKRQGYRDIGQNWFQMEVNRYENRVMLKEM